jgi:hypothetical protein
LLNAVDVHVAMMFAVAAMGAENTTFERDGEVSIGLTYMGTLQRARGWRALPVGRSWRGRHTCCCGLGW